MILKCKFSHFLAAHVQVNLCQKLLFLHQLTHNMTTDCSLNYKFNTWKFLAQNMFSPCSAKRRASDKDLPVIRKLVSYDWNIQWVFISYDWRIWWVVSYKSVSYRKGLGEVRGNFGNLTMSKVSEKAKAVVEAAICRLWRPH